MIIVLLAFLGHIVIYNKTERLHSKMITQIMYVVYVCLFPLFFNFHLPRVKSSFRFCCRHKGFLKDCPNGLLTEQVSLHNAYIYIYPRLVFFIQTFLLFFYFAFVLVLIAREIFGFNLLCYCLKRLG